MQTLNCFRNSAFSIVVCVLLATSGAAFAGGLLGDAINLVAPGVGTQLDDAHRQFKEAVPPYKAIEEGGTHLVNEAFVQAGAPALQELIARSRDDALSAGVDQIPEDIRTNLTGFIPDDILNIAKFRVQGGGDLTLQVNAIRYGEASAITLDYVIVFRDQGDAFYNPTLWAHELTHVSQYQRWGIGDFAKKYLRSYSNVEKEAYEAETRYAAWVGVQNASLSSSTQTGDSPTLNRPTSEFSGVGPSNMCGTTFGACSLNQSGPVGTPCWCNTMAGPATGSLVPANLAYLPPPRLPSGTIMQACGCWGPFPPMSAFEPKCSNGLVMLGTCTLMCAPGQSQYGYMCQ
jgi:Domain of unknown function (DUF4157)